MYSSLGVMASSHPLAAGGGITFVGWAMGATDPGYTLSAGSVTNGDCLIMFAQQDWPAGSEPTAPDGTWTLIAEAEPHSGFSSSRVEAWWAEYDSGTPPSTNFGDPSILLVFRGVDMAAPIDATQTSSSNTSASSHFATGVTTTVADQPVLLGVVNRDAATLTTANSNLSGFVEVGEQGKIEPSYGWKDAAGATGNFTLTFDPDGRFGAVVFALNPT